MSYVRRYVAADLPKVLTLARQFHAESPLHSPHPFDDAKVEQLLHEAGRNPDWLPAVAVGEDGDLIGIMLLFIVPMFFSRHREVGDLTFYVTPDRRGTRAAAKMLAFGEFWASAKNANVIRLGVNTGIRHDATTRFFKKLGYDQVGAVMQKRSV